MTGFNRVILAGNLTRDPQLSYTPNNVPVCEFGMAINRRWRDKDGNQQDEVCYVDVNAFGRTAELISQYLTKGRPILVEGRLRYRQWTSKEGQNRSKLEVVAENFQFLGGPAGEGGGRGGATRSEGGRAPAAEGQTVDEPPPGDPDIPF